MRTQNGEARLPARVSKMKWPMTAAVEKKMFKSSLASFLDRLLRVFRTC